MSNFHFCFCIPIFQPPEFKQKSQALRGRLNKSSSKNLSTTGVNDKRVWDENSPVLFTYNLLSISLFLACSLSFSLWVKADVKWKNSQCCSMPLNPRLSLASSEIHNRNDRHQCHENGLSHLPLVSFALFLRLAAQLSKK